MESLHCCLSWSGIIWRMNYLPGQHLKRMSYQSKTIFTITESVYWQWLFFLWCCSGWRRHISGKCWCHHLWIYLGGLLYKWFLLGCLFLLLHLSNQENLLEGSCICQHIKEQLELLTLFIAVLFNLLFIVYLVHVHCGYWI